VVLDNHGFASIGALSESLGSEGFGTRYRSRTAAGLDGEVLEVDFVDNARSLGAHAVRVTTREELVDALKRGRELDHTNVIVVETDREQRVGGHESWWDVPVAEVSEMASVQAARADYTVARKKHRYAFPS